MSGSKSLSLTFTEEILRKTTTKICQDVGWHRSHLSCLDVLSDLLGVYIHRLAQACGEYANQAGRTEPTVEDTHMAFQFMNIDLSQLLDLITNVESSPLENIPIPFYPITERPNRVIDQVDETETREEWYYPWLPSLDLNKASDLQNRIKSNGILKKKPQNLDKQQKEEKNQTQKTIDSPTVEDQLKSNGNIIEPTTSKIDSTVISQKSPDKSNKLVLKVSFSKSFDETEANQEVEAVQKEDDQLNRSKSLNVLQRLSSFKAFEEFLQSSLVQNPKMAASETIVADHDRLPICLLSPGMSLELDSPNNSNMAQSNMEAGNATTKEHETKLLKKLKRKSSNIFDFDDEHFDANIGKPSIKVKDPGQPSPKTKKKLTAANKDSIKPFSIKVTGFNLLANTPEEAIASMGPMFDHNLDQNLSNADNFNETSLPENAKKRKSRPPKEKVGKEKVPKEKKSRKPKLKASDVKHLPGFFGLNSLDCSKRPFVDDSLSKTMMPNTNSNDAIAFKEEDSSSMSFMIRSNQESSDDYFGQSNGSNNESFVFSDKKDQSTPASGFKKTSKPSAKRSKGVNSKKIVKSAEVVESSDDSSSGDDAVGDSNPVSLLPMPPEPTLDDILMSERLQDTDKFNQKLDNSSDSSNSAPGSPQHTSMNSLDEIKSKSLMPEDTEKSFRKKHKKKKHKKKKSKESKHHRSIEEKAERKKHKKEKKEKKREKMEKLEKSKEKVFKPKLNIKLKYSDVGIPSPLTSEKLIRQEIDQFESGASNLDEPFEKKQKKLKLSKKKAHILEDFDKEDCKLFMSTQDIKSKTPVLKLSTADQMGAEHVMINTEEKKKDTEKKSKDKFYSEIDKSRDEEKKKFKDKSKSEKKKDKEKEDTKSCKLYRETIGEKSESDWACPICNDRHLECDVVCCDNCDKWHHFNCLGIVNGPKENEKWFCPKCEKPSQRKSEKSKSKVKKEKPKAKTKMISDTYHNLPTSPMEISEALSPLTSPATPKTPGYIPTGRPRGRPRKDSSQGISRSSNAIGSPTFDLFGSRSEEDSYASQSNYQHHQPSTSKKESKKRKDICQVCSSSNPNFPMLRCKTCHQSYHGICIGYSGALPESKWFCDSCRAMMEAISISVTKSALKHEERSSHSSKSSLSHHMSLTDSKFMVAAGSSKSSVKKIKRAKKLFDNDGDIQDSERCAVCSKSGEDDADREWIACDDCSKWYHFLCVELAQSPPEDEPWFCFMCVQKQINIAEKFKKLRRF